MSASFLPPWSKPHDPHLPHPKEHYRASTPASLERDASSSSTRHRPGQARQDGSSRMAGHAEIDSGDAEGGEGGGGQGQAEKTKKGVGESAEELKKRLGAVGEKEKEEMKGVSEAYEKGDLDSVAVKLKELFEDHEVVVSVRDVKELIHNEKAENPKLHGKARFVLPVTEADIKGQRWAGREEAEAKKAEEAKKKQAEKDRKEGKTPDPDDHSDHSDHSSKGEGDDQEDRKKSDEEKKSLDDQSKEDEQKGRGKTDGEGEVSEDKKGAKGGEGNGKEEKEEDVTEGMSDEEKRFFDEVMAEVKHWDGLKNHDGKPLPADEGVQEDLEELQVSLGVQVDDQFTPDSWVPRSSHLLRLTGKHPLNAEPNLTELFEAGFQTPIKLHYVRNHAAVPLLQYETHTLTVTPLPSSNLPPTVLSMSDIETLFEPTELLLTIACDGNRRGEVNMVQKSAGFSWSSAGVSTCRWKGALIRDVLKKCGVEGESKDGKRLYLNYEGADQPSEGAYATSIPLAYAMDPSNDVLLAYGINGRPLAPDHGYPIRSIIPGFVGGRQVKWLKKLWISEEPNRSHYHIWDNRVVPSFVNDKHSALGKAFFHHPDTTCNEQILQSVICKPAHDELVSLTSDKGLEATYRIQGFAYNGNGLEVQKVELTLDDGKTWKYCFRRLPDQPLRHGNKFWAWVHWYCDVQLSDLANATEIRVRAWDPSKNTQPEQITWNYLGMMNNSQYRVRSTLIFDPSSKQPSIQFKHPVAPGCVEGGWMKPNAVETIKAEAAAAAADDSKEFSLEEVEKHNSEKDAWIILQNKVYNVSSVLSWHPGGASAILAYAGKATVEATTAYASIHDGYANEQRDKLLIGKLGQKGIEALKEDSKRAAEKEKQVKEERAKFSMNPFRFIPATLIKKKELSEDTKLYTFSLPKKKDGGAKLGLPIGKHIACAVHFKDGVVLRNYTPTRPVLPSEDDGTFDLLVKTYFPECSPFPPGGTMGNYLDTMTEGEELDIKGPLGEIEYKGKGDFLISGKEYHFDRINLIAGGSGLTPHWQLIHSILSSPASTDPTQISLINSNKTFPDILLYDELERYHDQESSNSSCKESTEKGKKGEGRFRLWYTLTGDVKSDETRPKDWKYGTERLDEGMMREHLFGLEEEGGEGEKKVGTLLCGPPGLITHGAMPGLTAMGFKEDETIFGF